MNKINLDGRKYLTPREVEEIFGIKSATLRRQRWGDYGMPYHKHNITNKILYCIEDIENSLKKIIPTQKGKKMINKKTPITDPKIFAQFLKDFIKKQNIDLKDLTKEQRVKKAKGGYISQIDKPLYYSEPGIIPTIKSIRQSFSEGGAPEDIVQIQMLIGLLENAQGLSPLEQKLLEELYQDLGRVSGGSK